MIRFIELTQVDFHTNEINVLFINIDKIVYFMPDDTTENSIIGTNNEADFRVKESVEEIKNLMQKAIVRSNVF